MGRHRLVLVALLIALATSAHAQTLAQTTLTLDLTATGTTVTVASTAAMALAHVVVIDREAMTVAAVLTATTVRVVRDRGGIATAHGLGSIVYSGPPTSFSREDPLSKQCAPGLVPNPYINTDAGTIWLCSTNGVWVQVGQVGPTSSTVQGNGAGKPTTFTTASVAGNVPAGGTVGQVLASTGAAAAWSSRPAVDGLVFPFTAATSPADGTVWVEVSGTSPTRVATVFFRDAGVTRTLFSVTY